MKCDSCDLVSKDMHQDIPEITLHDVDGRVWFFCCFECLRLWVEEWD